MINYPGENDINIVTNISIKFDEHYNSISFGEEVIKRLFTTSFLGLPLTPKNDQGSIDTLSGHAEFHNYQECDYYFGRKSWMSIATQKIIQIAKHFTYFMNLSDNAQQVLLKTNMSMIIVLGIVDSDGAGSF